ncbi:hypothetical protein SprV_0301289500 [Sparganum proliferum]
MGHNSTAESPYHLLATWDASEASKQIAVMLLLTMVVLEKFCYHQLRKVTTLIPESLILILLGTVAGYILKAMPEHIDHDTWRMTPETFFHYLLPCCLLDAAFNLHNRVFGDCIGAVIAYAVLATVLNMILIGVIMVGFENAGFFKDKPVEYGVQVLMVYASLIVAVDPVAVLAIFQEIGVELSLYYLVLGESLFNDAVTLVLYKITFGFLRKKDVTTQDIAIGIGAFFTINLGAILIGIVLGVVTCLVTQVHTHFEVVLVFLLAYYAYVLADIIGWSGIVAMVTCGMIQTAYAFHNLNEDCLATVRLLGKTLSEVCEAIIFLLIGVQIVNVQALWHNSFNWCALASCLTVRTVVVFSLTAALNRFNVNISQITLTDQFILAYGGLRGAVALSLAIMLDKKEKEEDAQVDEEVYKSLVTSTLFIIIFTVGVMGPTMKPLVKLFRVKLADRQTISLVRELNEKMIDQLTAGIEAIIGSVGRNSLRALFVRLDSKYIRPFLQKNPKTYNERIVQVYKDMALVLHYASLQPDKAATIMESLPLTISEKHMRDLNREHKNTSAKWRKYQKDHPFASPRIGNIFDSSGRQIDFGDKLARIIDDKKRRVMSMTGVQASPALQKLQALKGFAPLPPTQPPSRSSNAAQPPKEQ